MPYVFDTSGLIDAWTRYYPPDSFPRLWELFDELIHDNKAWAPQEVLAELSAKEGDALHEWVKEREGTLVLPTNRAVMVEVKAILTKHPNLTKSGTGRNFADPFAIAHASLKGCPVVTGERGGTPAKPRIPYVCRELGVDCISVIELIRAEGWQF